MRVPWTAKRSNQPILKEICKVKELEKAKFRKRMRLALYKNRSPLIRREGEAVRLVSCCTYPRKKYVYVGIYVESYCPLGGLFIFKVVQSSFLLNGWGKEFWR